ncbi:hypothetical protein GGR21_002511 [Dysgonomonas hofstadii]|uniref:Uncharacterized protein n=1 Tax=Dysgonomonas hofstadii TaxID=637886 RepID=A0A840CUU1_9BACT|nr:hypothetical protein [Dysgonomonas hofstadii]MBB4036605.1 hypothetical protein [Dysgonomonas hofstadii]
MKKDKTKTTGYYLVQLFLILVAFLLVILIKEHIIEPDEGKDERQKEKMVDYHNSEGREIQIY